MLKAWQLQQRQSLPLEIKERYTENRIKQWYEYWEGNVYVSFSGGKDSTVLLHQVRRLYPEVPAVFVDTGLEYPEIRKFVKTIDNVIWIKPKMHFKEVLKKYGYPVISKEVAQKIDEIRNTKSEYLRNKRLYGDEKGHGKLPKKYHFLINAPFKISAKCCNIMKKYPIKKYERKTNRKPYIGIMASESSLRKTTYLKNGCNVFNSKRPISSPMAFWTDRDVWDYIKKYNLNYSEIYNMGYKQTGCVFCLMGVHLENPNKFQLLKQTHPKLWEYCIYKLEHKKILDYINVKYE